MRYFLQLSYLGTHFCGWQRQPKDRTVQETLEDNLSILLREKIALTGCGRTDTGVHARYYIAHFDAENPLPDSFLRAINGMLPTDIAVHSCTPVAPDAHARFNAFQRAYIYTISLEKNPFLQQTAWYFPMGHRLDFDRMQALADILPGEKSFYTFCKSDSGLDHYNCQLITARWEREDSLLHFHISANRFLRGMVRLIVGASINAGLGKHRVEDVAAALAAEQRLATSYSVPPEGLALTEIHYPKDIYPG
ncbi:MAG: tRNA pseudouridine(38-40) synthase TruA [Saprospiraceae bacterium]